MPQLIVVRGRVDDDEYKYLTIPPLPRRRRGGRDDDGSSASLVRDFPEVGHQDFVRDGSRRHRSGPAARPAPSSSPRQRPPSSSSYPSSIALSPLLRVSHDGRRRRGGRRRATGASSRPPHEEGRGEDATRGHIDDHIILFGCDVHHVVVVVVVQVQDLVGRPLDCLPVETKTTVSGGSGSIHFAR